MACSAELHHQHASSSLKSSLLLLMILWIHVLLAHARTHHHHHHNHHVPRVWMEKLPFTPMPDFIQQWRSPMKPKTIREFLRSINDHKISSHSHKTFCHAEGMECEESNDVEVESSMPSFQNNDELGSISKTYFQKSDVVVGETISFQGMANNLPFRAFLPQKLAKKLPFSSTSLPELLNILGIASDSNVAKDMEETLRLCERGSKKGRKCVKSMEEMVGFVADKLGSDLEIVRTTLPSMEEGEKVVVREIALKGSVGQRSIVCNETAFPYMVLRCSEMEEVESIEVMVEREGKETYKGGMKCEKTSCEWRSGREVVFVSKEKRWVVEEEEMEKKDGYEGIDIDEEGAAKKKKEGLKLKKDNKWVEEEMEEKGKEKKDDEIRKEFDEEKEGLEGEKEEGDEKEKSEEETKKMLKGDEEEIDDHNEP